MIRSHLIKSQLTYNFSNGIVKYICFNLNIIFQIEMLWDWRFGKCLLDKNYSSFKGWKSCGSNICQIFGLYLFLIFKLGQILFYFNHFIFNNLIIICLKHFWSYFSHFHYWNKGWSNMTKLVEKILIKIEKVNKNMNISY